VAVQVAICIVPIVGVAAFALDCGQMFDNRRRVQAAADSAAMAAAQDLYANYRTNSGADSGGTAKTSATTTASANGFTSSNSTVTVNIPPTSGSHAGIAGYAEVIITYNQPRNFSGVFGSGSVPITGRAVARGLWTAFGNGIIVLDPTGNGTLTDSGNGTVTVSGGSIVIDSSGQYAATVNGNGTVTAPEFLITGTPGDLSHGNGKFVGGIDSGVQPTVDPLLYLPEPKASNVAVVSSSAYSLSNNQSATINPGRYVGGISVTANATLKMNPGLYYMDGGGFKITGNGNVTGTGVTIYNAPNSNSDTVSLAGNGNITLTPQTAGDYEGITVFQERTSSTPLSVTGNGAISLTGTFYAAHATLNVAGNGSTNLYGSQYITYELAVSGNGAVNISYTANGTAKTRNVGIVE
jgi:hypothetical protein